MSKTLKEWRTSKRLTQTELGERAGISPATICRIENDKLGQPVLKETAEKIVAVLGLSSIHDVEWPRGIINQRHFGVVLTGQPRPRRSKGPALPFSLRWWREKRNLSASALAEKAGVWNNTIWNIENDYTGYSVNEHVARQLADALGLLSIHEIRWPRGVSNRGCAPGISTGGGHPMGSVKTTAKAATCGVCFLVIQTYGCGCTE